jgi:hypothetical protein
MPWQLPEAGHRRVTEAWLQAVEKCPELGRGGEDNWIFPVLVFLNNLWGLGIELE